MNTLFKNLNVANVCSGELTKGDCVYHIDIIRGDKFVVKKGDEVVFSEPMSDMPTSMDEVRSYAAAAIKHLLDADVDEASVSVLFYRITLMPGKIVKVRIIGLDGVSRRMNTYETIILLEPYYEADYNDDGECCVGARV